VVQEAVLLILVVEDDSLVRDIVRQALEEGGFQTEMTASGEEAITLLNSDAAKYRALLTDIQLMG
jgi:CheY-like chemotaxis protein